MSLTITADQQSFTPEQLAALDTDAGPRDLAVFLHIVQRTHLDPFAGQIRLYAVDGRQVIQAGIDGFRLVGRRAADASGEAIDVAAPMWAHPEDGWITAWRSEWGNPVAASVTIRRGDGAATAVAHFDEYAPDPLSTSWRRRPAGQLAKCAEALAWRMAFPLDLAGIYTDDELAHTAARTPAGHTPNRGSSMKDHIPAKPRGAVTAAEILGGVS